MEYGDWARAFEVLVPLADAGHCEAARLSVMLISKARACSAVHFPQPGRSALGGSVYPISPFQAMQQRRDSPAVVSGLCRPGAPAAGYLP